MKKIALFLFSLILLNSTFAQRKRQSANTSGSNFQYDSLLYSSLKYRLAGPFRGGRSAAVTGDPEHKNLFYMGAAGGGVWKTQDGGNNWKNISDKYFGGSIGSVAVAPSDNSILYVGEGENSMRGNVSEGLNGIWKSDDGGRSWLNRGLKNTRHITRIIIHPKNPSMA